MRSDSTIVVRDPVELFYDKSMQYKSLVHDIMEDGSLIVAIPSHMGVLMPLEEKQELQLAFYRNSGRYIVDIRVDGFKGLGKVNFAVLKVLSKPVKEQRRNYYRLPISVKVLICRYPMEDRNYMPIQVDTWDDKVLESARTTNLSMSGIALKTKNKYEFGEKYLLKIFLGWPHEGVPPLMICGEVKRVNYAPDREEYHIGMHFIDHNEAMGEYVAKYILLQQQKIIKQKRLIEGE